MSGYGVTANGRDHKPADAQPISSERAQARLIALALLASGLIILVVAAIVGAVVDPLLYAIALVSLVDFTLAWLYATARIGPAAQRRRAARESGDAAALAEEDPSYNPYARED